MRDNMKTSADAQQTWGLIVNKFQMSFADFWALTAELPQWTSTSAAVQKEALLSDEIPNNKRFKNIH